MNRWLADDLKEHAKKATKIAEEIDEIIAKVEEYEQEDHIRARIEAENELAAMKREMAPLQERLKELEARAKAQTRRMRAIRQALNAKGKNPLEEQAHQVFQALKAVNPEHPIVKWNAKEDIDNASPAGVHLTFSRQELRYLYAVLNSLSHIQGNAGCNDFYVDDPSRSEIHFLRSVWRYHVEEECYYAEDDKPEIPEGPNEDGRMWGPPDFTVVHYLQYRLRKMFGGDLFEDAKEMLL